MSYSLILNGKLKGQVGNAGFYDMAGFCAEHGGDECKKFFAQGFSEDPKTLREELGTVYHGQPKPPKDVANTIRALMALLHDVNEGTLTATCA